MVTTKERLRTRAKQKLPTLAPTLTDRRTGLAPGKYTVRIAAEGFGTFENTEAEITAGRAEQMDATLKVTIEQQKVTVAADTTGVNTDPENNVGALVLRGKDRGIADLEFEIRNQHGRACVAGIIKILLNCSPPAE